MRSPRPLLDFFKITVLLGVLGIAGCPVDDAVNALNKASDALNGIGDAVANGSATFAATADNLANVLKGLPSDVGNELREALSQSAREATQAAGIEARCSADFARARLAGDIKYLAALFKARALKQKDPERPERPPVVCQSNKPSVRRDQIARQGTINWDGYDFIRPSGSPKLAIALERPGNHRTPVDILSVNSNYMVVADLSHIQQQLTPDVTRLVLVWGDNVLSQVPIEQAPGPKVFTTPVTLSLWGPKVAARCPHPLKANADNEFNGHGPKIDWSVTLSISSNKAQIIANISYHALECDVGGSKPRADFSEACGNWTEVVYSAPSHQQILRIIDNPRDSGSYVNSGPNKQRFGGHLYQEYELGGDGGGDDVGRFTTIQATRATSIKIEVESTQ